MKILVFLTILTSYVYGQTQIESRSFEFNKGLIKFSHMVGSDTVGLKFYDKDLNLISSSKFSYFHSFSEIVFPEYSFVIVDEYNNVNYSLFYYTNDSIVLFSLIGKSNTLHLFSYNISSNEISELDMRCINSNFLIDDFSLKLYYNQSLREKGELFVTDLVELDLKSFKVRYFKEFVIISINNTYVDILNLIGPIRFVNRKK